MPASTSGAPPASAAAPPPLPPLFTAVVALLGSPAVAADGPTRLAASEAPALVLTFALVCSLGVLSPRLELPFFDFFVVAPAAHQACLPSDSCLYMSRRGSGGFHAN